MVVTATSAGATSRHRHSPLSHRGQQDRVRDVDGRDQLDRLRSEPDDLDDPEAARLRTLLAQIEEAILTREPGHDHLAPVESGV